MQLAYDKPFIDVHTHLFPERLRLAIGRWFEGVDWAFWFDRPWEEAAGFLEAIPNLERYVCCGYAHKPGVARELNRFYAEVPQLSPKAAPLGCAHQDDDDLGALAEAALALGLSGFKLHCQVQKAAPDDPRFWPLYQVASEAGAFVLLHAGTGPFAGDGLGFEHVRTLLTRFPRLKMVVAHLGCFEAGAFLRAALDHEGLYLDTAYTFVANPTNRMEAPVELVAAAAHKVLFASDFPGICHPYAEGVAAIARLPLSDDAREAVFYRNARALLAA